jgi:hypothetical protein
MSFQNEIHFLIMRSGLHRDHVNDRDSIRSQAWRRGFARGFLDILAAPVTLLFTDRTRTRRIKDIILRELSACDEENGRATASNEKSNRVAVTRPTVL